MRVLKAEQDHPFIDKIRPFVASMVLLVAFFSPFIAHFVLFVYKTLPLPVLPVTNAVRPAF